MPTVSTATNIPAGSVTPRPDAYPSIPWTSPLNVQARDGQYAVVTVPSVFGGENPRYGAPFDFRQFDLSALPADATITKIELVARGWSNNGGEIQFYRQDSYAFSYQNFIEYRILPAAPGEVSVEVNLGTFLSEVRQPWFGIVIFAACRESNGSTLYLDSVALRLTYTYVLPDEIKGAGVAREAPDIVQASIRVVATATRSPATPDGLDTVRGAASARAALTGRAVALGSVRGSIAVQVQAQGLAVEPADVIDIGFTLEVILHFSVMLREASDTVVASGRVVAAVSAALVDQADSAAGAARVFVQGAGSFIERPDVAAVSVRAVAGLSGVVTHADTVAGLIVAPATIRGAIAEAADIAIGTGRARIGVWGIAFDADDTVAGLVQVSGGTPAERRLTLYDTGTRTITLY